MHDCIYLFYWQKRDKNKMNEISISIKKQYIIPPLTWIIRKLPSIGLVGLICLSITMYIYFYMNKLGLAYNDARSHLDIGRRVVEGLKPGLAQLGSVWLPLPHLLMVSTIWNDFMWHSGLAGALVSMISFIVTSYFIYKLLEKMNIGMTGRLIAIFVFATNLNILYLQSTAMTELLLILTMTAAEYELISWYENENTYTLLKAATWIMLSTLIRYDGWFLLFITTLLIAYRTWRTKGYKATEGTIILFCSLAGLGIALWLLWNLLIFKDPLYFAFGPYSAHAQQDQLEKAGVLATKKNLLLSIQIYLYAFFYNSGTFVAFLGLLGALLFWFDKKKSVKTRLASSILFAPLAFNVLALYLGHSVLFVQGVSGNTWFNVRYGIMMISSVAIFVGYLVDRMKDMRPVLIGLILFVTFFSLRSGDAVTIDDARVGSSQKNVTEVSEWLAEHAKNKEGFVLISAASHDAIIFSSTLPMSKFIHEGTGGYWTSATIAPDRWARWIVMRTYDTNDVTYREVEDAPGLVKYKLVGKYPFADIYELKEEFVKDLNTKPVLGPQN